MRRIIVVALGGNAIKQADERGTAEEQFKNVETTCAQLVSMLRFGHRLVITHRQHLDAGERPMDWKPEVCWQVPLRLEYHTDEVGHTTHTLREWRRRDWGEGGQEFHWWCTEESEAFTAHEPLVTTCRDDIVGLVGEERYELLRTALGVDDGPAAGVTWLPHPAVRRR